MEKYDKKSNISIISAVFDEFYKQKPFEVKKKAAPSLEKEEDASDDSLFDEILSAIGNDGKFQKYFNWAFNFVLVSFLTMPYLNLVLGMSVPKHHCHVPGRNESLQNLSSWQSQWLPKDIDPKTGEESLSSCKMFINETEITGCTHGWDYEKTWYTLTAPSMQDWVCENELHVTNTFVASTIGHIIGIFCFGQLGDRIGRKPVFFISLALLVIGRTLTIFSSGIYNLFLAVVLFGSASSACIFQTPIVIGMEISAKNKSATIAFMQNCAWVLGNCVLPLITWGVGDWRYMIILTTWPCASAYLLYKWMPESPRWLASRGRVKDSAKVLSYIAKVNGNELPDNTYEILEKIAAKKEKIYGIPSLFSNKRLAKYTVLIVVCWTVNSFSYYSLILNTTNMAGNPFMNFFWQSLVELPGYVIGQYLSNRFGRRWTHTGSYAFAVLFCTCVIVSHGYAAWLSSLLVACVRFFFTVAYFVILVQAMEVYPTCVRQTGTSIGGLVANIFGIFGPYVVYLGTAIDGRLPYVVLLAVAVVGALCSCMLPETLNKKLPETLEDVKDFGNGQKFWSLNVTEKSKNNKP